MIHFRDLMKGEAEELIRSHIKEFIERWEDYANTTALTFHYYLGSIISLEMNDFLEDKHHTLQLQFWPFFVAKMEAEKWRLQTEGIWLDSNAIFLVTFKLCAKFRVPK